METIDRQLAEAAALEAATEPQDPDQTQPPAAE
jgi:hypothetical protein